MKGALNFAKMIFSFALFIWFVFVIFVGVILFVNYILGLLGF